MDELKNQNPQVTPPKGAATPEIRPGPAAAPLPTLPHFSHAANVFYSTIVPIGLDVMAARAIPFDVIVVMFAQAHEESASEQADGSYAPGTNALYREAHNALGLRWFEGLFPNDLPYFEADTWEVENGVNVKKPGAKFRRFACLRDCIVAYWLTVRKYPAAMAALTRSTQENPGWKLFAASLGPKTAENPSGCGYSTNSSYAASLTWFVSNFRLWEPRTLEWLRSGVDPGNSFTLDQLRQAVRAGQEKAVGGRQ